jgi:hypothetical protein
MKKGYRVVAYRSIPDASAHKVLWGIAVCAASRPAFPVGDFLAATPEFTEHPKVADAASELLRDVFGDQTVASRLVFGVASRPLGSPVELEVIVEVKP